MTSSSERATRYMQRQREAGRKMVTLYLHPDTIAKLKNLAKGKARGEIVERAVNELCRVSGNKGDVS